MLVPKPVKSAMSADPILDEIPDTGVRTAVELISTLSGLILDPFLGGTRERRFAARLPLTVLGQLGVPENAIRLALSRHVRLGLLSSTRVGRIAWYSITDSAAKAFGDTGSRMQATKPFASTSTVWTLVSFSIPESRRELRSRLRIHLNQCGFRPLRDGLWVALEPFAADRLMRKVDPDVAETAQLDIFIGSPYLSTGLTQLVRRSWDVDELRSAHLRFLARWEHSAPSEDRALAALTLFTADWVALLNHDPGLPAESLDSDWPGERSVSTALRLNASLRAPAGAMLARLISPSTP